MKILISWTSPFPFGRIFHFYSNFNRTFSKQIVKTLIRCILQRLIWACTVCLCTIKRTLGLYGLIQHFEADFLWKVSLKILNSGIILKTFTHVNPYLPFLKTLQIQIRWLLKKPSDQDPHLSTLMPTTGMLQADSQDINWREVGT